MKVLFVATVMGHFNSFHLPYMQWFQEKGWEVHVAANNDMILPYCNKKYVLPIVRSPLQLDNFKAYRLLKNILKRENYDIIHCHTPMGGFLTRLAAIKARKYGTKVIYTAHGFHFFKGSPVINWLVYYPIEKVMSHHTDVLITINKEDYAVAQKKMKAKKVVYVPGVGIDVKKFANVTVDRERKRTELGLTEDAIALLSVGELSKRKNHEVIIHSIAKSNKPNIIYVICGQGNLESYLKGKAKDHRVDVRFLGRRDDIPEILSAADIFVFPSYQEGLPVALMEAMAAGLPIVCSNIRGNTDLINDGNGGYLVDPNDIEAFAKRIDNIIECDQMEMGLINKKAIKPFDISIVIEIMKELYEKEFPLY